MKIGFPFSRNMVKLEVKFSISCLCIFQWTTHLAYKCVTTLCTVEMLKHFNLNMGEEGDIGTKITSWTVKTCVSHYTKGLKEKIILPHNDRNYYSFFMSKKHQIIHFDPIHNYHSNSIANLFHKYVLYLGWAFIWGLKQDDLKWVNILARLAKKMFITPQ